MSNTYAKINSYIVFGTSASDFKVSFDILVDPNLKFEGAGFTVEGKTLTAINFLLSQNIDFKDKFVFLWRPRPHTNMDTYNPINNACDFLLVYNPETKYIPYEYTTNDFDDDLDQDEYTAEDEDSFYRAWHNECAREQGMLHGLGAYNDYFNDFNSSQDYNF